MYQLNRATFNPTDDLVLNDGVLWDIRTGKSIHKFDKFNQFVSGVFHPMGLELIINSEVVSFFAMKKLYFTFKLGTLDILFHGFRVWLLSVDKQEIQMKVKNSFALHGNSATPTEFYVPETHQRFKTSYD